MKRYLYILGGIIVLAAVVVLGLFLWKNYSSATPAASTGTTGTLPSTGTQGNNGGVSAGNQNGGTAGTGPIGSNSSSGPIVAGSFGPLSTDPVLNYFVAPNNTVLVIEPTGVIAQIVNGQISYVSSSTATEVIGGAFSYNGKKAFINFGDPNNPQTSVFDVATKAWTALPHGIQSPAWSPSDYRIAYLASVATGTETLATIDASNAKAAPVGLLTLHVNNLSLQWVNKGQFILEDRPSIYAPGSALAFDAQAGTLTPIETAVPGLESIWSVATTSIPSEGLLFFGGNSGSGGNLQLDDFAGNVLQNLSIATLPSKCGFAVATSPAATSSLALYCGIPRNGDFASARLPDDYNQLSLFTSDDIYQINAETGAMNDLWNDANQNVDVSNLRAVGNSLFFINRYNNELYTLTFSLQ